MIRGTRKNGPCRCGACGQDALAVEARPRRVVARHVARLDDLRGRGDAGDVEFGERVDVAEQVAELLPEPLDLFVGQSDARELGDVTNVDAVG